MKALRRVGLALVAVGLLLGPAALADDPAKKLGQAAERKVDYLDRLARFDRQQIDLANLALQRSQEPRVRELANRLVRDHKTNLNTLRAWAKGRAMEIAALAEDPGMQEATGGSGLERVAAAAEEDRKEHLQQADAQSLKAEEQREKLTREAPEKFDEKFLSHTVDSQKKGLELLKQGQREFEGDVTFATVLARSQPVVEGHVADAEALKDLLD